MPHYGDNMRIRTFTRNCAATRLQIRARVIVALFLLEAAPAAADAAAPAAAARHADQSQGLGPDELHAGYHLVAESLEEALRGLFACVTVCLNPRQGMDRAGILPLHSENSGLKNPTF